jgi:hypothetical protein
LSSCWGQSHQHIARRTEVLHRHILVAQTADDLAHLVDVGRLFIGHLNDGAACEFHRQVQPFVKKEKHCRQKSDE